MVTAHEQGRGPHQQKRADERAREEPRPATLPSAAAIMQLQRGAGNQAVARMMVQRKVANLDVDRSESANADFALRVQRYNATPAHDEILDPGELLTQQKRDLSVLRSLLEIATDGDQTEYIAKITPILESQIATVNEAVDADRRRAGTTASKSGRIEGPLTFGAGGFPRAGLVPRPTKGAHMFPGIGEINVVIGGQEYPLSAGQVFLNPRQSTDYQASPAEIKAGSLPIFLRRLEAGGWEAVLGDFHHRFVWNAFHGVPLTAELKTVGFPADKNPWSSLTYTLDPKHDYEFEARSPVTNELVFALASRLPEFLDLTPDAPDELLFPYIKQAIIRAKSKMLPDAHIDPTELPPLRNHLGAIVWTPYDTFVRQQVAAATNQAHAQAMAKILLDAFPSGYLPPVMLRAAPSMGNYNPTYNVIVLDPTKNPNADTMLDTLAYESGNALRREDFIKNAKLATQIEFQVTDNYVKMLMEATHSGGINSLINLLNIDPALTNDLADAEKSLEAKKLVRADGTDAMPATTVIGEQYRRTALSFYLQQDWAPAERQRYFATSQHAEGMAATATTYNSNTAALSFASTALSGTAQPSLKPVVESMAAMYTHATPSDFDALEPRQFGEFLQTGRVERWHSEAAAGPTAGSDGLMLNVIRDLGAVYPNRSAWEPRFRSLSNADFGEFMLYGKVRSWEDRELMIRT
jgi:hypothetical protein